MSAVIHNHMYLVKINEGGGGVEKPQNLVNVVYGCPFCNAYNNSIYLANILCKRTFLKMKKYKKI